MTAPLTPPHQPHSDNDSWQAPPAGGVPRHGVSGHDGSGQEEAGPDMKTEMREAVVIAVAVTVSGVLLGLLWAWLAPRVPLISDGEAVFLKETEGEQAIGGDGTFILLALGLGALSGLAVFLWRRRGGVPLVVGLAVGGLLASVLAWRLGLYLGPGGDVVARAKAAGEGVPFDAPLDLRVKGALLAWPIAASAVHLGLTALFAPRDPEPLTDHDPYRRPGAGSGGRAPSAPHRP
ncbi:hypothetical protein [Streptomyces sp. NPDC002851]